MPGVAIGVQAIQIMPEHCTGYEYSLTASRNGADVMDILGIVLLVYPVCPVHKVKQRLASVGNLVYPRSSTEDMLQIISKLGNDGAEEL